MGISGLHPLLKPYVAQSHAREFRGRRLGVDAWAWLHRGAVGAARELATGERPWRARGSDAPWVAFCLKMVAMLQAAGATPVLVFDGCRLPAKAGTNAQRRQRREEARARGLSLLQQGREPEANAAFAQGIHVTPEMALELIARLRERGVQFVVAPYEADAQLAHLASLPEAEGGVAAVVTEDSDLVAYGCRRLLFKMDGAGYCWELSLDRLLAGPQAAISTATATQSSAGGGGGSENGSGNAGAAGSSASSGKRGGKGGGGVLSFQGWTLDMLQAACVLAGCDFLPSLKGVSFRTAAGFVARGRCLEGALRAMQAERRFRAAVTEEYRRGAAQALAAFKHALVFCHNTAGGSLRRLAPLPAAPSEQHQQGRQGTAASAAGQGQALAEADVSLVGAELDAEVARGLAYGYLHPHTLQPFAADSGAQPSGPATQQGPLLPQQQPQQQQQQFRASLAGRRQLGSWMAGASHSAGLGPSQQQHRRHQQSQPGPGGQPERRPQQAQKLQSEQQQHPGTVNVADVLRLYQPQQQHAAPAAGQHQMPLSFCAGASLAAAPQRNPFARLQPTVPAAAAGAGREAYAPPAHANVATAALPQQQGSLLEVADTQGSATVQTSKPAGQQQQQPQHRERQQAVPGTPAGGSGSQSACTNGRSSEIVRPASSNSSGSDGAPTPASLEALPPLPPQHQQHQRLWDRAEQHPGMGSQGKSWGTPLAAAAAAGSKRKSSGSSGGGGKRGPRHLAPPSQRISRFFTPAPKPQ